MILVSYKENLWVCFLPAATLANALSVIISQLLQAVALELLRAKSEGSK